ncbi:hypothetical protein POM88_044661 [Heracleum sosnowskyi]|uniref:Uncharacterized protein n=1 Tax=Heracleum sosnowskyi TaxID=360622 RepID=A0AAD8H367_9APIA|nr:hypothetical protein POM88_044661 [Heracleum sosnowskyi]
MANFCCPIEMEPKTLNEGQLNQAREVAVDIVLNKEAYEATKILVEGLKPVSRGNMIVDSKIEECKEMIKIETACQCSLTSSVIDSPADNSKPKEPLSAPF